MTTNPRAMNQASADETALCVSVQASGSTWAWGLGSLAALVRFYPSATGGFYLTGGLGVATLDLGLGDFGSASDTGMGALLGIGYDIRVGRNVSLSPFWNGIGGSCDEYGANFGQIGVGVTVH